MTKSQQLFMLTTTTSDRSETNELSGPVKTGADQKWKEIRQKVLEQMGETSEFPKSDEPCKDALPYHQLEKMLLCKETLVLPCKANNKENVRNEEQHDVSRILATLKRAAVPEQLFSPPPRHRHNSDLIFANSTNMPESRGAPSAKRAKVSKKNAAANCPQDEMEEKGLHGLCRRFIQTYSGDKYLFISVDDAAKILQVERRRVYDVVNILECLDIIARECKNTYRWKGMNQLPSLLGRWQAEAISLWPKEAQSNGLEVTNNYHETPAPLTTRSARILVLFLQRFLVGEADCCLSDECEKIFSALSFEKLAEAGKEQDPKTKAKSNQRRLYDIANVLMSLNIIQKSGNRGKNTTFQWSYHLSTRDIQRSWKRSSPITVTDLTVTCSEQAATVVAS